MTPDGRKLQLVLRDRMGRGVLLFGVAVLLTVLAGYAAFFIDFFYNDLVIPNWTFNCLMVFLFAASAGLATGPIVAICLLKKNACLGMALVFVPAAIAGCLTAMLSISLAAIVPVPLMIVIMSVVAFGLLPDRYVIYKESLICPVCKYDLRARTGDRCPECGAIVPWLMEMSPI